MDRSGGTISSRDPTPMPPPSVVGVPSGGGGGGTGTLKNRSASRNAYHGGGNRSIHHNCHGGGQDRLSKDFQRKRWLILALLSSEIEVLVTYQNPLDTKESLVASMTSRDSNVGKDFENAMSYLETEVRVRTADKAWREHVRNTWEISPTLAVYLPQRINYSMAMEKELSRLVRVNPEEVSHIPKALDYFLTRYCHSLEILSKK